MGGPMQELLNDTRYKLYAKRGVLQAHLEMIEIAIQQHNRHFEDTTNLCEHTFRVSDSEAFARFLSDIEAS
jgi:hypothetical protein